jgi:hydrogenase maturation protease
VNASRSAVLCLGNRFRGDDAFGLLVADRLRESSVPVFECADEPTRLLDSWSRLDLLVIVDAARTGVAAGTVRRIELGKSRPLDGLGLTSSHAFGIEETLEVARALGRLPRRVVIYAVEAKELSTGGALTPAVAAAVEPVVRSVRSELEV